MIERERDTIRDFDENVHDTIRDPAPESGVSINKKPANNNGSDHLYYDIERRGASTRKALKSAGGKAFWSLF